LPLMDLMPLQYLLLQLEKQR